jgi:hypothetical protein
MMTRRDYIKIAMAIKMERNDTESAEVHDTLDSLVATLVGMLSSDNDRFDEARFVTACGSRSV